jgi:hypothetical protein
MGMAYTGNPRTSERTSTTRTRRYFGSQIITNFFFHRYVSRILSRELLKNKTNVIEKTREIAAGDRSRFFVLSGHETTIGSFFKMIPLLSTLKSEFCNL